MPKVEIYTSIMCGYCTKIRASMRSRSGGSNSVPQIFIDNDHIGGCRELYALENAGYLDKLLAA